MKWELESKDEKVKVYVRKELQNKSYVIINGYVSYNVYSTNNFYVDFDRLNLDDKKPTLIWDYIPSNTLYERAYAMVRHMVKILEKEGYKEKDGIYLKKYWQVFDTMIWYRQIKKGGFNID